MKTLRKLMFTAMVASVGFAGCGDKAGGAHGPMIPTTGGGTATDGTATTGDTETPTQEIPVQTAQPQELTFPDEDFRKEQPAATAPRPFQLPGVKQFALKNGIKVYLVEDHKLPVVSMELSFDGGSLHDPADKPGLASVCMDMLTEGTERLDKIAYNESLADIASSINSYAGDDQHGIAMRSLSKHFDATFALFAETLGTPGFRQAELERMVKRRLEALKQAKASPGSVADRVYGPVLYGAKHPFGAVTTESGYGAITVDDCKAYHAKYIQPKGARLFVVGDMTEAQVREKVDGALATWKGTVPARPRVAKPSSIKGKIFFVDIPGAAQSSVYVVHFGPQRKAKDYMATYVMSSVLGGGFSSRINMNLREDKGYSYGARGAFGYNRDYGVFTASSSVRSDSTYQTIREMYGEINAIKSGKSPATDEELGREKNGAILSLPARFASGNAALAQYRGLVYFGLPMNYYNKYVDEVGAVNAKQVAAAAKKHLDPNGARIIVVGDSKALQIHREEGENAGKDVPLKKGDAQVTLLDGLKELLASGAIGKGEIVVLDADGNVKETIK